MSMSKDYCFCTLAVGDRYRTHAKMLAEDLLTHAPGKSFVVLSDKPSEFEHYSNVRAFAHRLQSVKGYHDKRFVLEKAVELHESCIFLDADIRMLGPVSEDLPFSEGLIARYGCGIVKHNTERKVRKAFSTIQAVADTLHLDLEDVFWFHEFMFMFSRQQGKEKDFFEAWQSIAYYFESQGIYDGSGNIMGLAAAAAGLNLGFYRHDFFANFKDNIQKEKVRNGEAAADAMAAEFKVHREIEYPQRSLPQKVSNKFRSKITFFYRLLRLRFQSAKDAGFQRLNSVHSHSSTLPVQSRTV
ncbi:MAG: hypothetical protein WBD47_03855 [Phormidesmis sp.]